jgi:hypothetical protein
MTTSEATCLVRRRSVRDGGGAALYSLWQWPVLPTGGHKEARWAAPAAPVDPSGGADTVLAHPNRTPPLPGALLVEGEGLPPEQSSGPRGGVEEVEVSRMQRMRGDAVGPGDRGRGRLRWHLGVWCGWWLVGWISLGEKRQAGPNDGGWKIEDTAGKMIFKGCTISEDPWNIALENEI